MTETYEIFGTKLTETVEKLLTRRRAKRRYIHEKNSRKGPVREWVEAIAWAVLFVFLINQFIFQLYQIPSPSMEDTLLIKDRVFVDKAVFGPEIYPGGPKVFNGKQPLRDEIIIFENPDYESRGPLFDIVNRVVYMVTLSLVNLDKDEMGNPRSQLYVKRALGYGEDTLTFEKGDVLIKPAGFADYLTEEEFRDAAGLETVHKRLFDAADYEFFTAYAQAQALLSEGISPSQELRRQASDQDRSLFDYYHIQTEFYQMRTRVSPHSSNVHSQLSRYENGFYLPDGYILPIGDNRDNSGDGRYFGPVPEDKLLGKAIFTFWPLSRIGLLD
jgi:signal peptidase I